MADVVNFPNQRPPSGHPLMAVPGLADRCRSVVAVLPVDLRAAALVAAAAQEISGRVSAPEAQELCVAQVRMVLQALQQLNTGDQA